MATSNLPRPLTEEQAAEEATVEFLRKRFPKMSRETAGLWMRAMAKEAIEPEEELEDHVYAAREKTKATLKQANVNRIRRGLEESLKGGDYFEVFAFMDDAKKMGIDSKDINDIIDATPTDLDREALKKEELPLSAIA